MGTFPFYMTVFHHSSSNMWVASVANDLIGGMEVNAYGAKGVLIGLYSSQLEAMAAAQEYINEKMHLVMPPPPTKAEIAAEKFRHQEWLEELERLCPRKMEAPNNGGVFLMFTPQELADLIATYQD